MQKIWQTIKKNGLGAIPILKLRQSLLEESKLTQHYLVLILASCLIATLGLLINSTAVIIGAMIVAPLMLPIRGFSFATLEGDLELLRVSSLAIIFGTILSLFVSWMVGAIVGLPEFGSEVMSRTQPTLIDLSIAVVAGAVGGYAKIRPSIGDAIPGVAISVALMPPLCVVGLSLSQGDISASSGAMLLYITNLTGINLACLGVYVISGYARSSEFSRTLSWGVSIFLFLLLAIPLGISFWQLSGKTRANNSLKRILVSRAFLNRPDIKLTQSQVNWKTNPPSITLTVQVREDIQPEEVQEVEKLLKDEMGQPFTVTFDVTLSHLVKSSD
ncbi:DUF389 domain-containing protein [Spirulina sp. 06S082]|uniref:DUF389 domain-containing protein n=1 Tax=Spirulina sp. 06S082 TaxID=3110248 RepID=UPI002B1FF3B0|nr:DUF389 domain-containing protein [Spirulina sp. 06S082]MEA5471926.1 DUF389 domain-containing protein [Spirulina sp. 06S082]